MFELREGGDGQQRVYLLFLAQSPNQMRNATPLTLAVQPLRIPIRLPGCSSDEPGYPCLADAFVKTVRSALDADCMDKLQPGDE